MRTAALFSCLMLAAIGRENGVPLYEAAIYAVAAFLVSAIVDGFRRALRQRSNHP